MQIPAEAPEGSVRFRWVPVGSGGFRWVPVQIPCEVPGGCGADTS